VGRKGAAAGRGCACKARRALPLSAAGYTQSCVLLLVSWVGCQCLGERGRARKARAALPLSTRKLALAHVFCGSNVSVGCDVRHLWPMATLMNL
jgi:hypothetical protein